MVLVVLLLNFFKIMILLNHNRFIKKAKLKLKLKLENQLEII